MRWSPYALAPLLAPAILAGVGGCRDADPTRDAVPGASDPSGGGAGIPAEEIPADECAAFTSPTSVDAPSAGATSGPPALRERGLLPSEVSIVAVGDSLTFGQSSTHPGADTSYPAVLSRLLGIPVVNRGVPSHGTKDLPDVDYLLVPGKQNRLVVMIGTNDIHNDLHATASETFARLATYVAARERAGWLVTVNTPPKWLVATPSSDREAMEYESMIRLRFPHVADVAASPLIGRGAPGGPDRAYYGDELGHLNDAGYALLARIVRDAPAPRGADPDVPASVGVPRTKCLTGWFRDWVQGSALPDQLERPANWLNIVEPTVERGLFEAFGRDRPSRVVNAMNGRPALRFNGPSSGFFIPRDRLTADFLRANAFVISVVMKVENINSASAEPYDNDGVFSDSKTRVGMSVRWPNTVTAFTYDGTRWTHRDAPVPFATPVVVSMRLWNGKLGLRVHTSGEWSEIAAPSLDTLDGVLRIGTDSTNLKTFWGMIADVVVRKSYCDATMAADDAYFRARYGVP